MEPGVGPVIEATSVVRRGRRSAVAIVTAAWSAWTGAQIALIDRRAGGGPLVVLDIDNTIADSWPSFLGSHRSERARLATLEPLPNIKAVAHDAPLRSGATVVFLSHRHPWEWPVTRRWLRAHGFDAHWWNVVLVPSAAAKVPRLRRLAGSGARELTVWDDLSRGHESGELILYSDVIDRLRGISLRYHGWADIVAVTGRDLDRPVSRDLGGDAPGRG